MDSKLWTDPKVLALAKKVKSYADPNAKKDQNYNTTMEVKLNNGNSYKAFEAILPVRHLIESAVKCCERSFARWPAAVLVEERIEELIEAVGTGLETYDDAAN